jgi:hypothetical protein
MPLSPQLRETLAMVGAAMRGARDDWWIIASAAVALHGAEPVAVADVDLLTSAQDAHGLAARLGLAVAPGIATDLFRSDVFGRWRAPPLEVEIMAGLHVRSGAGWTAVAPATRERIDVEGRAVFVPSRRELQQMLLMFGRPKDRQRARLLSGLA